MLVNAINGSTSTSDITDSQSVIQFDVSDFLMLDDAVESKNAHHDISEGDESSGRAGLLFSLSCKSKSQGFLGLDSFQVYT